MSAKRKAKGESRKPDQEEDMKILTQRREAKPDGAKQRGGRMLTLIGDLDRITGSTGWEQGGKLNSEAQTCTRVNATVIL